MLRFLIQKFKEAPGPLRQTRIVLGDLTEEILDLAEYYWKQRQNRAQEPCCGGWDSNQPPIPNDSQEEVDTPLTADTPMPTVPHPTEAQPGAAHPEVELAEPAEPQAKRPAPEPVRPVATPAKKKSKKTETESVAEKEEEDRSDPLEPSPRLAQAIADPINVKKQDFKVLAILWDLEERGMPGMNANDLSAHGERLGLSIRHENIRKVIRLRLSDYVETIRFSEGEDNMYRYELTPAGKTYFEETFLK